MSVLVGRPKTLEEAQDIVAAFPRVKANGVGHSWWALQFCSGDNDTAINVVMTELKDTLDLYVVILSRCVYSSARILRPG